MSNVIDEQPCRPRCASKLESGIKACHSVSGRVQRVEHVDPPTGYENISSNAVTSVGPVCQGISEDGLMKSSP
jgi:hypothetical protein